MVKFALFFIVVLIVFVVSLVGFIRAKKKIKYSQDPISTESLATYRILLIISSAIIGAIIIGFISLGILLTIAVSLM